MSFTDTLKGKPRTTSSPERQQVGNLSFWVNPTSKGDVLTGYFGNARVSLFLVEKRKTDKSPHYYSVLSAKLTKEQIAEKLAKGEKPDRGVAWNSFWERKTSTGKTYLEAILTSQNIKFEIWPNDFKTPGSKEPDALGRIVQLPRQPKAEPPTADEAASASDSVAPTEETMPSPEELDVTIPF